MEDSESHNVSSLLSGGRKENEQGREREKERKRERERGEMEYSRGGVSCPPWMDTDMRLER